MIQDIPDKEFFKTLSCLKNKDPKIYDNSVQFFNETPVIIRAPKTSQESPKKELALSSDEEEIPNQCKKVAPTTKSSSKFSLKDIDNDSSSEDELAAFTKETEDKPKVKNEEENEYIQFLKGSKSNIGDKEAQISLKPLHDYWNKQELDENEKFLKDYILNKKYLSFGTEERTEEVDLSEDERELEEQAEYETNYNFRFENEENLKLKRFPRNIEGSLRRKNDSRSKKRAEIAQRKKEEKLKKQQEIKKKQKEKLSEIEERLQKIKELTGNVELGFKDEEILEDFDPEKHDQRMKELFNEEYYTKEDNEYPVFDNDGTYFDNDEINMDCEADSSEIKQNKLTRTQKKKLKKNKTYKDVMELTKPSFDPTVHNDFKKYIDEYYSMDCEDFIDDLPCKFKYREVVPNDYGLSIEEILIADDNELNRWASVKKLTRRRPDHVEKNEVKIYKKKAHDEYLKKKMLPSLFIDPQKKDEEAEQSKESDHTKEGTKNEVICPEDIQNGDQGKMEDHIDNSAVLNEQNVNSRKKKRKRKRNSSVRSGDEMGSDMPNISSNPSSTKEIQDTGVTETGKEQAVPTKPDEPQKKKRKKKNKNKSVSTTNEGSQLNIPKSSNTNVNTEKSALQEKHKSVKYLKSQNNNRNMGKPKNNVKNKVNFKRKKDSILNLSDNRLQAYGVKPKQFRSKILYSNKNETS